MLAKQNSQSRVLPIEPHHSDEDLMQAYKVGDDSALRGLYERYAPLLLRVLGRDLDRTDDAKDLVQQTFLQLHRARFDFRDGSKLRPWLMTIALNLKRKYRRTKSRRPKEKYGVELATAAASNFTPEDASEAIRLRHALMKLRPKLRDVMILYWFEGFSFAEIALIVGARPSAVKLRAHRGKQQLRVILGANVTESARLDMQG